MRAAKVDANHSEIVSALRKCGISVQSTASIGKGFPDLAIIIPRQKSKLKQTHLIFIEMKRAKGGKVSAEQDVWIEALNEVDGVAAYVCFGVDSAIETLTSLLK